MDLPFRRIDPEAALPAAHHPGDAGLDLRANADKHENMAKMQSKTASAPRTVSTFVGRTFPITQVMMHREIRNTIRLTCRR